jgi:NADPH:quinone reductase-like Zn-dependent oxidoreductase
VDLAGFAELFLKRKLSFPVSRMWQRWVRRSSSAVVILGSPANGLPCSFKRISVRGFFLSDPEHAAKILPLVVEAAELLRSGRLHAPVAAAYPLSAIKDAVAHVQRGGKVLLDVAAS